MWEPARECQRRMGWTGGGWRRRGRACARHKGSCRVRLRAARKRRRADGGGSSRGSQAVAIGGDGGGYGAGDELLVVGRGELHQVGTLRSDFDSERGGGDVVQRAQRRGEG